MLEKNWNKHRRLENLRRHADEGRKAKREDMRVKEAARELKAQPLGRVLATAVYLTGGGGRSVGQSTFGGPVLGCIIDTSDGESRLNFRDFSRSTRSAFFCTALNSFSGKIVKNN